MKTVIGLACLTAVVLLESGCATAPPPVATSTVTVGTAPPPTVVAEAPLAPPPPPTGYVAYAPDYYVWDGNEYVGVSNGQYVYWTGGAWIMAPPVIVGRFHGWTRYHPDWRRRAVPYHRHFR